MAQVTENVACPNCGHRIDVNDILYRQVDEALRKKYQEELVRERDKFKDVEDKLLIERRRLDEEKTKVEENVAAAIKTGLAEQRQRLQASLKAELADEQAERLKTLRAEIVEKSAQLKSFHKTAAENERLKRQQEEMKIRWEAEAEKRFSAMLDKERGKIMQLEREQSQLRLAEREKVIEQLNEQLKSAQRKAEQGSTQLQGEVQELAIEAWLSEVYPLDRIEEIKKGARGADCLQIVNTRSRPNCGTIYYESKRTKAFQAAWIEKFRNDIREKSADIGVLVTSSMPADMPRLGIRDGVWICTFEEFKGLSLALRESLINLSKAISIQDNKGDKMGMLYDFLTGNEFSLQVEAIVEGFTQMQADLEVEKRLMATNWKKREKQIQKVLLNTSHMYGSIKGIAGNAIQSVPLLEANDDSD